ncbi:MAG: hypothetical protein K1X79_13280 [Oligoflexia bacterium]|nr:hypothetical protein [Oligoflexia bacterium]
MSQTIKAVVGLLLVLSFSLPAFAASKVKGKAYSGTAAIVTCNGKSAREESGIGGSFNLSTPCSSGAVRVHLIDKTNSSYEGPFLAAVRKGSKYYSVPVARLLQICKSSAAVGITAFKRKSGTTDLGTLKVLTNTSGAKTYYSQRSFGKSELSTSSTADLDAKCRFGSPLGTTALAKLRKVKKQKLGILIGNSEDLDGDGRENSFDPDDDGDGVGDAFETGAPTLTSTSVRLFSNLKPDLSNSVNVAAYRQAGQNETDIASAIDTLMSQHTTLAIPVLGDVGTTTELNCTGLNYCSADGTGTVQGAGNFPGSVGDATYDPDSDGFGTITAGGTGDFQLQTGANSSEIKGGDVITEIVTDSSNKETTYSGILNFTYNTSPAVTQVVVGSDAPITISYPVTGGSIGTSGNPISVPNSGDVTVTLTVLRPERAAYEGTTENDYHMVGHSLITIDLPNAPGGGSGVGNCVSGYATSDAALSLDTSGAEDTLTDTADDAPTSASNTVTFSINLTDCLANPRSGTGAQTWAAGQSLSVDVQFRNSAGDNAAQKLYFQRLP